MKALEQQLAVTGFSENIEVIMWLSFKHLIPISTDVLGLY